MTSSPRFETIIVWMTKLINEKLDSGDRLEEHEVEAMLQDIAAGHVTPLHDDIGLCVAVPWGVCRCSDRKGGAVMSSHAWLGLTLAGAAVLVILISIPLWRGRVKMNHIYGMRVPKAFQSDELWLDINRYGGKWFVIWSLPLLAIGVLCMIIPFSEGGPIPIVVGMTPVLYLIPAIQTYLYSRKL